MRIAAAALSILMIAPAFADDAKPAKPLPPPAPTQPDVPPIAPAQIAAPKQPQPCERGQNTMKIGGLDMDEIRCAGFVQEQQIMQLTMQAGQYETQLRMLRSDLDAAKAANAELRKQVEAAKK